jgi:hypothetical protein
VEELQQVFKETLGKVAQTLLEKRLAEKIAAAGLSVDATTLSEAVAHLLDGNSGPFKVGGDDCDATISVTDDDVEYVAKATDEFRSTRLPELLDKVSDDIADKLLKFLARRWAKEFEARQTEMEAFKERLEHRWGKALDKLRMLLAIVMEWAQELYERRQKETGGKLSHLDDVLRRLHVRACQVTNEIIILLENGYADGAMARWRTLHEIATVAAVIAKFGEDMAERYVHYQIVESFKALLAYEKNHRALGFRPMPRQQAQKIQRDYEKAIRRFGKEFSDEYGWARRHLKGRITFASLEAEAGDAMMRSPYKMASYNVHASPKGVCFRLGNLGQKLPLLAGASNAGLMDPAQHAAVSLAEITRLTLGDSPILDDIVAAKIIVRLEFEIPGEFAKADRKLRRDDRRHREANAPKRS